MTKEKPRIAPSSITFLTTYKCTAMCDECALECSPYDESPVLNFDQIKSHIDNIKKDFPSIRLVVFSGGEPFMMGENLRQSIEYVKQKKMLSRIVTNGYWARSLSKAKEKIKELKESGLTEINFSTGEDHQKYVPIDHIINGVIASAEHNMLAVVNVEAHEDASFSSKDFLNNKRIASYFKKNPEKNRYLLVMAGVWIPLNKERTLKHKSGNKINIKKKNDKFKGCKQLFKNIVITPYEELAACCGLTFRRIPEMILGKVNILSVKEMLEKQYLDFMKIWIMAEGAERILLYSKSVNNNIQINPNIVHPCQACEEIYSNQEVKTTLSKHYEKKVNEVFFKLQFNSTKDQLVAEKRKEDRIATKNKFLNKAKHDIINEINNNNGV